MKKMLFLLFSLNILMAYSQELPSEPANGAAFPIGTKFVIKLYSIDSETFNYSIIAFEPFQETVNSSDTNNLFEETGEDDTIEFYFCYGTSGETESEKEKNMKIYLLMKNYTKYALEYKSDILRTEDGEFEPTSNIGCLPGIKTVEMWPYMIYMIGIRNFRIMTMPTIE